MAVKSIKKFLFLDRDGTLIRDIPYNCSEKNVYIEKGAAKALYLAKSKGFQLVIVTNQSAIGRGLCSSNQVDLVNSEVKAKLESFGVIIDSIRYCPHVPEDDCDCRKPKVGMISDLIDDDFHRATKIMVGDQDSDMKFGNAIGALSIKYSKAGISNDGESKQIYCSSWSEIGTYFE
jgi:D-glycero-D-manno-heptose 1,7-bisphosphate phosphatase